jgi:hypothetical protein
VTLIQAAICRGSLIVCADCRVSTSAGSTVANKITVVGNVAVATFGAGRGDEHSIIATHFMVGTVSSVADQVRNQFHDRPELQAVLGGFDYSARERSTRGVRS